MKLLEPSLSRHFQAVNEVEKLLRRITGALDADSVPYCVIGGNAVAAWVSTVDPGATRTTKDVDLLLRESDMEAAKAAAAKVDLDYYEVLDVPMFLPRLNPNPKTGAHIILAGKKVRDGDLLPAPDVHESRRLLDGFNVVDLGALLRMKLLAFRLRDQTHLRDMFELNLITPEMDTMLPEELRKRLEFIRNTP
jgi:hypothetical protein